MVLTEGWDSVAGANARLLQQSILPGYLANQRWFAAKGRPIERVALADAAVLPGDGDDFLILTLDVSLDGGEMQRYLLPLAIAWETASDDPFSRLQSYTLARARTGGRIGAIHDAVLAPGFARAVAAAVRDGLTLPTRSGGQLVFHPTAAFPQALPLTDIAVDRLGGEQSNTSLLLGEDIIVKALRRLAPGVHPEVEIGRFLTEVAHFPNTPPLFGSVEMRDGDGVPTSLLTLQGFVRNQGDGWEFSLDHLDRLLGQLEFLPSGVEADPSELYDVFLALTETLGRRVAELHQAFALPVEDPAFRPEPAGAADATAWGEGVLRQAGEARVALNRALEAGIGEEVAAAVRSLLGRWQLIEAAAEAVRGRDFGVVKTRLHGDLHLGQVVVVRDDFDIIDFEGEPLRSMDERRTKGSPLKDVAGMLRSFDYAASTALHRRPEVRPGGGELLRQALASWRRKVVGRFLEGYRTAIGDCPSVPAGDAEFQALLDLFMLEKVLYEIRYEAANRPDWLAIPVHGALAMLHPNGEEPEDTSPDGRPLP